MTEARWEVGAVIAGRYRVQGELGRGGMGVVLSAEPLDASINGGEAVALKVFLRAESKEDWRRFAREARVVSQLDPAGVCRVVDAGATEDGRPYIAMELLLGEDLDRRLQRTGPLPIDEAVAFVLEAAEVLAEAHLLGIVHRDVKPHNLFVARLEQQKTRVKVLDFGIAKASRGTGRTTVLTKAGEVLGSPAYMAPEQLADSRAVDHRVDVWALGATLFEMVSGHLPFSGDSAVALCSAVFRDAPHRLLAYRFDAPLGFESAIHRCLEKDPDDRYPNVAELAMALAPFASPSGRAAAERIAGRFAVRGWQSPSAASTAPARTVADAPNVSVPQTETPPPMADPGAASAEPSRTFRPSWWLFLGAMAVSAGAAWWFAHRVEEPRSTSSEDDEGPRDDDAHDRPVDRKSSPPVPTDCPALACSSTLRLDPDELDPLLRRDQADEFVGTWAKGAILVQISVTGVDTSMKRRAGPRNLDMFLYETPSGESYLAQVRDRQSLLMKSQGARFVGSEVPASFCPLKRVFEIAWAAGMSKDDNPVSISLIATKPNTTEPVHVWYLTAAGVQLSVDRQCAVINGSGPRGRIVR